MAFGVVNNQTVGSIYRGTDSSTGRLGALAVLWRGVPVKLTFIREGGARIDLGKPCKITQCVG